LRTQKITQKRTISDRANKDIQSSSGIPTPLPEEVINTAMKHKKMLHSQSLAAAKTRSTHKSISNLTGLIADNSKITKNAKHVNMRRPKTSLRMTISVKMLPDSKTDALKKSKDLSPPKKVFLKKSIKNVFKDLSPLTKTRINEPESETAATPPKIVKKDKVTTVNGFANDKIDRTRFDVSQPDKK